MELLVLANSYKEGGRCLAGVGLDGPLDWIRPVDPCSAHGEVPAGRCRVREGDRYRDIELLDVLDVPLGRPSPATYQPENVELGSGELAFVRRARRSEVLPRLEAGARTSGPLLGIGNPRWIPESTAVRGLPQSLDLILVDDPMFEVRLRNGRRQARTTFAHDGRNYDLPVTDPAMRKFLDEGGESPSGRWLLTVSLGVPWDGSLWLLIAGCIKT